MNNHQKHEAKIAWMLAHRALWENVDVDGLWRKNRDLWRSIAGALVEAGLASAKTGLIDFHIGTLILQSRARVKDIETKTESARAATSARQSPPWYSLL